ncbi:CYP749A22 protein [Hibiscus syriacus]|uniref:CYP749A22 protein n=1 Tax=Hibiscus syriacus TaxID=106335 RepID=A0A6A3CBI1_HIBSY|nr:cytochrome P450 CYP749A22-like [Hibiscus syriacus]KAE8725967.1 CYP749A22 protein [Hibiscus syriacus]
MDFMVKLSILFVTSVSLYLLIVLLKVLHECWWVPRRIQRMLNSQGIKGPPYEFIHGNNKQVNKMRKEALSKPLGLTHDIFPRCFPHVRSWLNLYGKNYLTWDGAQAQVVTVDPELIKEVLKNGEQIFPKRKPKILVSMLVGEGLLTSFGEKWAKQRRLANYVFHGESLKNMTPAVIASVETMLDKWKDMEGKEIEIFEEFRLLTSEVISRTAFGSSYLEGEKIFDLLKKLSGIVVQNMYKSRIPILSKLWKDTDEIESKKLAKEVEDSVMEIVKKRENKVGSGEAESLGCDFLGLLVNAFHDSDEKTKISLQDLIDECKTFYFAGQETTNSLLAWAVLVLAVHGDWQEKARREVIEIFGNQNPHSQGIAKLKIMSMIIYETLRLYTPVNGQIRKVASDTQVGKLVVPANIEFWIPNMALHHDPNLWGEDANAFKPERFEEGIGKATKYNAAAYIPFGMGPRTCVGMSFAINETKTALSMILQRYSIALSPAYVHSPLPLITLRPQHGIQVLLNSNPSSNLNDKNKCSP